MIKNSANSVIATKKAPAAIGPYSQARRVGDIVFISGQIPLNTKGELQNENIEQEIRQIFDNLSAICEAAGGSLQNIIKVNVYLTDLAHYNHLNNIMQEYFIAPYPARAAVEVSALPKNVNVEVEAVMQICAA